MSRKSYEAHKRLYYDGDRGNWIKKRRLTSDDDHQRISMTEEAIEQFDFAACGSDQENETVNAEVDFDDRPPLVDFNSGDDVGEPSQDVECGSGKIAGYACPTCSTLYTVCDISTGSLITY